MLEARRAAPWAALLLLASGCLLVSAAPAPAPAAAAPAEGPAGSSPSLSGGESVQVGNSGG